MARYFTDAGSPWNTKLPVDAPLSANSAAYVADLQRMLNANPPASVWWINRDAFTTAVYEVDDTVANVPVFLVSNTYVPYTPGHTDRFSELAYRLQTVGVPIPAGATPSVGSDKQMTIVKPSTGELWEMWVLEFDRGDKNAALAGQWSCMYGGWMPDHRQNIGQFQDSDFPGRTYAQWGATATSLPLLAGLMMEDELNAGLIPHALEVVLPDPSISFVWPAQRGDGYSGKLIPEGSIFRLKPSVDVSALSCGADAQSNLMLRTIAKAMQDYGLIVNDKTGVGESISLRMEGGPNRTSVSWGSVPWNTMLGSIPTTDFEFIDPAYRPAVVSAPSSSPEGERWGAVVG